MKLQTYFIWCYRAATKTVNAGIKPLHKLLPPFRGNSITNNGVSVLS